VFLCAAVAAAGATGAPAYMYYYRRQQTQPPLPTSQSKRRAGGVGEEGRHLLLLAGAAAPRPPPAAAAAAVGAVVAATAGKKNNNNNVQTVKHASTQAELVEAIGDYTTIVLTANILLENSTAYIQYSDTGIVIEHVRGLVINGSGFAIDGQGMMRCMYVASADVVLVGVTLTNGKAGGSNSALYAVSRKEGRGPSEYM